jgi:hypothetical protein
MDCFLRVLCVDDLFRNLDCELVNYSLENLYDFVMDLRFGFILL